MTKDIKQIQIGRINLSEAINHEGKPYIFIGNDGEGMGLNKDQELELEEILKQFLYKHF